MESSTIMEEGGVHREQIPPKYPHYGGFAGSTFPMKVVPAVLPVGGKPIRLTPILPVAPSSKMANLHLKEKADVTHDPLPLTLKLPTPSKDQSATSSRSSSSSSTTTSAFEVMSGKLSGGGDNSMISVA